MAEALAPRTLREKVALARGAPLNPVPLPEAPAIEEPPARHTKEET